MTSAMLQTLAVQRHLPRQTVEVPKRHEQAADECDRAERSEQPERNIQRRAKADVRTSS